MKTHPKIKDSVANTLFIPLIMRAIETERADSMINDVKACELVEKIDYDFSTFKKSKLSLAGTPVRTRYFDKAVEDFIDTHKHPVVVNLGCGLDTRYFRVPNKNKAVFYELDIDEVIDFREKFLPTNENDISIKSSMFEIAWMDKLKEKHPDGSFLFICEGVLMYFAKSEAKSFMKNLAEKFNGAEIYFDMCNSFMGRNSDKHEAVKHTQARFKMGIDDPCEPEDWSDNIELMKVFYVTEQMQERIGFFLGLLFKIIPVFKKSYGIFSYKFL